MRFNSFDQVAKWYNDTKPVVSKNHTKEHDVRPIGSRARKWERVKKIDDNTYALLDGNYGNTVWGSVDPAVHLWENRMAPIVWSRRADGDFIRVRNHAAHSHSVTRYNFLMYHLPNHMRFWYNKAGKHFVRVGGEDYPLPKAKTRFDYQNKEFVDDNTFIEFRVNGDDTFTRVSAPLAVEVPRIDKELKKVWGARLQEFYTYCAAIAPLVDTTWHGRQHYRDEINEWLTAQGKSLMGYTYSARNVPTELARDIVTNTEHPLRVAFATLVVADIDGKRVIESEKDISAIKMYFNRVMNKVLGFYTIEEK